MIVFNCDQMSLNNNSQL